MGKYKKTDVRKEAVERLARHINDGAEAAENVASALEGLADKVKEKEVKKEIALFKALGDDTRLLILKLLREGELCGCEIMTAIQKPQSSTSHHVSILKKAGLIKERQEGRWSYYRLADGAVLELMKQIRILADYR